jgi:hypothetical protein
MSWDTIHRSAKLVETLHVKKNCFLTKYHQHSLLSIVVLPRKRDFRPTISTVEIKIVCSDKMITFALLGINLSIPHNEKCTLDNPCFIDSSCTGNFLRTSQRDLRSIQQGEHSRRALIRRSIQTSPAG